MPLDPASFVAGKAALSAALGAVQEIRTMFAEMFVAGEISAEQLNEIAQDGERSDVSWDERVRRARERLNE